MATVTSPTRTHRELATPGLFAVHSSKGAWRLAPHLAYLDGAVMDALHGRLPPRLIVTMPPRHGKSEYVSKYLPAWYLGRHPSRRVILTSYEADFAKSWGRKVRNLLERHGSRFDVAVSKSNSAADRWDIANEDGGMNTAGSGGPITGKGANLLIVDDAIKNAEAAESPTLRENLWNWWQSTAYTRLEPDGVAIVMHTRWHHDDLIGRLLREERDEWHVINLPAIAEPGDQLGREPGEALWPWRYPLEKLAKIRTAVGPYYWSALYQQRPPSQMNAEWPGEYFEGHDVWFDDWPPSHEITHRVIALDPSMGQSDKSDYQAFVFIAKTTDGAMYVDADLCREDAHQLSAKMLRYAREFKATAVAVESNGFQQLLVGNLDAAARVDGMGLPTYPVVHTAPKRVRIRRLSPYLGRREIRFRRNSPGVRLLVQQLREFPNSQHDDGPDALEMAIETVRFLWSGGTIGGEDEGVLSGTVAEAWQR